MKNKSLLNSYGGIMAASSSSSFSRSKTGMGNEVANGGGGSCLTNPSMMLINEDQLDVNLVAKGNMSKVATAVP